MENKEIATIAAETATDVRAQTVLMLHVAPLTAVCDYFVITSAPTRIQTKDIAKKVEDALTEAGVEKIRIQGRNEGGWILLDYGMVVVHIFLTQEREFYDLEGRWSKAEVVYDSNNQKKSTR